MLRLRNHLLFWLTYVFFKTYLNVSADSELDWDDHLNLLLSQLSFLMMKVPLVYFCFFVIDNYLSGKWKQIKSFVLLICAYSLAIVGMTIINHKIVLPYFLKWNSSVSIFAIGSLMYHFFNLIFITGAAVSIRLFRRQYKARLKELELQKEKTETELKYLKGQINPHFLFNTLNNIYSLARKGSEHTAESVLRLSKLMRFMLYESGNQSILLADELKLIQDYIELEKLRYSSRLKITYQESIDNPHQKIAPLILIHFVENAFKHGASESRARAESYILINIILKDGLLSAIISNSKSEVYNLAELKPIGMENIKRQLELVYPNHQLLISDQSDKFMVELIIPLITKP